MTNMDRNTPRLTEGQTKVVRALDAALDEFFGTKILPKDVALDIEALSTAVSDLAKKQDEVFRQHLALQGEFPEVAEVAAAGYYGADYPEDPEFVDGPDTAVFEVMLALRAFFDAETLTEFARLEEVLRNQMYDLKTYSDGFDSETGHWKEA